MSDTTSGSGVPRSGIAGSIDTERYSARLRPLLLNAERRSVQLTSFERSGQLADLSEPPLAGGYARVHHFRADEGPDWLRNPLPIIPACRALGIDATESIEAITFQSAGCNWRCWYCYVPFEDLTAHRGDHHSIAEMVATVEQAGLARGFPLLVDLTGGQPDLTPEWPLWFLDEADKRGLDEVYVWSDDNLSTDYLWRYLSQGQITRLAEHPRYGKVGCLKGFDSLSFAFNTRAAPDLFDVQIQLVDRLARETHIDLYLYATFTSPTTDDVDGRMLSFAQRLYDINPTLLSRLVPLKVAEWGPVGARLDDARRRALTNQYSALSAWVGALDRLGIQARSYSWRTASDVPDLHESPHA